MMDSAKRKKVDIQEPMKKTKVEADLEVTGVSRSGRVRKKSSKLVDFESSDDIETRFKRATPAKPQQIVYRNDGLQGDHEYEDSGQHIKAEDMDLEPGSESETEYFDSTLDNQDSMDSDSEDDGLSDEDSSFNVSGEGDLISGQGNVQSGHPSHSLYMMEKSNKKKLIVKDGKVVGRAKAQRKDKGRTRVTAYMLWARSARDELLKKNPELDVSTITKRLGEMWSNVNFQERYLWKRKAKRFTLKNEQSTNKPQMVANAPVAQFIPRQQMPVNQPQPRRSNPAGQAVKPQQNSQNVVAQQNQQQNVSPVGGNSGGGVYKVAGCGPVEVAAHLRLLGESLAIIGERLKEHEGQIAVSGSVSVLLDTLLCSLAPLICLTTSVPEIAPPTNLLQDTLDNIAYIMPGL